MSLTVVVGSLAGMEGPTFRTIVEWTEQGALGPSLWLTRGSDGAAGQLVTEAGTRPVNTSDELADRTLPLLRVVSLHLVPDLEAAKAAPESSADLVLLDPIWQNAIEGGIGQSSVVLIAPAAGIPAPASLYDPRWNATFVLAPEDRAADHVMPARVGADFLGRHAAGALATVGSLWRWSTNSPVANIDLLPSSRGGVRVIRSSARLADGGHVLDQIADAVLTVAHSWPTPEGTVPPAKPASNPAGVVESAAELFAVKHRLAFVPTPVPPNPGRQRMGLWEGIKQFFAMFWKLLKAAPVAYLRKARAAAEQSTVDFFQRHSYGPDSSVVLTLRGATAGGDPAPATPEGQYEAIRAINLPGANVVVAEPTLWTDMQRTCAGLIDAGDLPDGIDPSTSGAAREVVLEPKLLAPSPYAPNEVFEAPELGVGRVVRTSDARGAANLAHVLQIGIERAKEAGADESRWARRLSELRRFTAVREGSFTWRVGSRISVAADAAALDLADALEILSRGAPGLEDTPEDEAERRRFRRLLVVTMLILALVVGGAIAGGVTRKAAWTVAGLAVVVAVLIWLLVAVSMFTRHAYKMAQAQFARLAAYNRWLHAHTRAFDDSVQLTRFSSLYWQFLDWSEVLGGLVHRPWGEPGSQQRTLALADMDRARSVVVADAVPHPDQVQRAVANGQKAVITKGWLGALFKDLGRRSTERYQVLTSSDVTAVAPELDTYPCGMVLNQHIQTGEDISTPRGDLLQDVLTGRFAGELRQHETGQLIAQMEEDDPDALFSSLKVHGSGSELDQLSPRNFLTGIRLSRPTGIELPLAMFRDRSTQYRTETTVVGLPRQLVADGSELITSVGGEQGHPLVYAAIRLDCSAQFPLSQLVTHDKEPVVNDTDVVEDDELPQL